jgi:hypothetical protein
VKRGTKLYFEDDILRILFLIAPKAWDEKIPPDDYPHGDDIKEYKANTIPSMQYCRLLPSRLASVLRTISGVGQEWTQGRKDPVFSIPFTKKINC